MTQSQITYFLTVAETLSFSKAANVLFVSQPAVSKQVSLLEEELGLTLFDRTRQGVFLTDAGRLFNDMFQDFSRRYQETLEEAQHINGRFHDVLRIGCSEGFYLSEFYADAQALFEEKYPNLALEFSSSRAERLLPMLREGKIDLILSLGLPPAGESDLIVRRLTLPQGPGTDSADSINVIWINASGPDARHLFVNELLFHFRQTMEPE